MTNLRDSRLDPGPERKTPAQIMDEQRPGWRSIEELERHEKAVDLYKGLAYALHYINEGISAAFAAGSKTITDYEAEAKACLNAMAAVRTGPNTQVAKVNEQDNVPGYVKDH